MEFIDINRSQKILRGVAEIKLILLDIGDIKGGVWRHGASQESTPLIPEFIHPDTATGFTLLW